MTEVASRSAVAGPTYAGALMEQAYSRLVACVDDRARVAATAQLILAVFDDFYAQLCEYPYRAKRAFESMDPHASIRISRERLELYSRYISEHGPRIYAAFPALSNNAVFWKELDRLFVAMIFERYEADIAFSFVHSIRRNIDHGIWRPVAYSFPPPSKRRACSMAAVHRRLPVYGHIDVTLLTNALQVPAFTVPFRDLRGDAEAIRQRLEKLLYRNAPGAAQPV
jgi:isocitrate dehydrogenase kinase/phosphatase